MHKDHVERFLHLFRLRHLPQLDQFDQGALYTLVHLPHLRLTYLFLPFQLHIFQTVVDKPNQYQS